MLDKKIIGFIAVTILTQAGISALIFHSFLSDYVASHTHTRDNEYRTQTRQIIADNISPQPLSCVSYDDLEALVTDVESRLLEQLNHLPTIANNAYTHANNQTILDQDKIDKTTEAAHSKLNKILSSGELKPKDDTEFHRLISTLPQTTRLMFVDMLSESINNQELEISGETYRYE